MITRTVLLIINIPEIQQRVSGISLLVVPNADIMSRRSEGNPGDVHPSRASQELVGVFTITEEFDQALELSRVLGTDVGGLTL